jgi:hypothetical protein
MVIPIIKKGYKKTMYIKTERNDSELKMSKISSKEELINEIKTLSNTLSEDISNEKNIIIHTITEEKATTNPDMKNIIELQVIFDYTEQILSKLTSENPIKIKTNDYPFYKLTIELDEDSKLKITAASDLDPDFTWDTLIQWFPAS